MGLEFPDQWVEDYGHPHMVEMPRHWISDDPTDKVMINVMSEWNIEDPEEDCFLLKNRAAEMLILVNVPPSTFWTWLEEQRKGVVQ